VGALEGDLLGVQYDNIGDEYMNFTFRQCIIMLFVDSLIYAFLAWYFDKVEKELLISSRSSAFIGAIRCIV